jgi:hypothetical protein
VPRRFFYVHVQKAAGTEVRERLKRNFAPAAMYPDPTDGDLRTVAPQVSVAQLLARWTVRKDEIEIITGHFPYATHQLLDADFVTLSVLREPVERVLSHLRHHRKLTPGTEDMTLEALYDDVLTPEFFHNHMVKMFSLSPAEIAESAALDRWPALKVIDLTPDRLATARANVEQLDVLGLQDDLPAFCEELTARFGWDLGEPLYANRTPAEDAPAALRRRIAADNALDAELWEHARTVHARRG